MLDNEFADISCLGKQKRHQHLLLPLRFVREVNLYIARDGPTKVGIHGDKLGKCESREGRSFRVAGRIFLAEAALSTGIPRAICASSIVSSSRRQTCLAVCGILFFCCKFRSAKRSIKGEFAICAESAGFCTGKRNGSSRIFSHVKVPTRNRKRLCFEAAP